MLVIISIFLITFLLSILIKNEKTSNTFFDFTLITFAVTFALFIMDISFAIGINDKSKEIITDYTEKNENHLLDYGLYSNNKNKFLDYLFYEEEFIYISITLKEINKNPIVLKELNDFIKEIEKNKLFSKNLIIYLEDKKTYYKLNENSLTNKGFIVKESKNTNIKNYIIKDYRINSKQEMSR